MNSEGEQPRHYRVGIAAEPQPEDPYYSEAHAAVARAQEMAAAQGRNVAVAVWDSEGEPVWLFMLGKSFRRA